MVGKIYKEAFGVIAKKPLRLWGTSILAVIINTLVWTLFGIVPGVAMCLSVIVSVGMSMVYLHGYRGEQVEPFMLFDGFKNGKTAARTIKGMLYKGLILVLWGLPALLPILVFGPFFLIPNLAVYIIFGILLFLCLLAVCLLVLYRSYQYCLTPYILVEEEDGNPFEAYKESAKRTKGYVLQLLLADLIPGVAVFLLTSILSLITWGFTAINRYLGIIFLILFALIELVVVIVLPLFLGLVHAAFYEELTTIYKNGGANPAYGAPYQGAYPQYPQQPAYDPNAAYQQPAYDPNAAYQQPAYDPNAAYQQPAYDPNAAYPQQPAYDPNAGNQPPYQG